VYAIPVVSCASAIILPRPTAPATDDRVLFGRVWFAGRRPLPGPSRQPGTGPFDFFAKTGIAIRRGRGGALVEIAPAWRSRARLTWGGVGSAVAIRFRGCDSGPAWTPYAGGFLFRDSRGGCVPVRVTVGSRSRTIRFALGRRC
jgi:hypothetical protein